MPFKSDAQRKLLFLKHPEIAKRFAAETPPGTKLPEHVGDSKKLITDVMAQRKLPRPY